MNVVLAMHGVWRWVVLLAALGAMTGAVRGAKGLVRLYPIALDIQVLLGLVLWVGRGWYASANPFLRVIHPVLMLLAVAAAHMGGGMFRKGRKAGVVTGMFVVSLLLIILGIPNYAWSRIW